MQDTTWTKEPYTVSEGLAEMYRPMSGNFPEFSSAEDRKEANGY